MSRDDIYKYFKLKSQLYSVLFSFVEKKIEGTEYTKYNFKIKDAELLAEGMLRFTVQFDVDIEPEFKYYCINIKELEEF